MCKVDYLFMPQINIIYEKDRVLIALLIVMYNIEGQTDQVLMEYASCF